MSARLFLASRKAGYTALISSLLFLPLLGIRLNDAATPLTLAFNWMLAVKIIVAISVLSFVTTLCPPLSFKPYLRLPFLNKHLSSLLIVGALALPLFPFIDRNGLELAILLATYIMLATGLNIVVGFTGLLDLGFIAFFGIGAYTYAILALNCGWGFWVSLPASALVASLSSLLLGLSVLRLRGDYFAITTLGFGQIVYTILVNWRHLTNGSQGIANIPRPSFLGLARFSQTSDDLPSFSTLTGLAYSPLQRVFFLYYLILALTLMALFLAARLRRLPLGRAWEAVREDEIAAATLGIQASRVKLTAYMISAAIAGMAGAFFAARQGFISPESFTFMDSAIVLAIVVLGGSGSPLGLILATFFLIGIPEIFRELADYRMLAFGAAMVIMMRVRPRGLITKRTPSVKLNP